MERMERLPVRKLPKMNDAILLLESTFQERTVQRELDKGEDVGWEEGRDVGPDFVGELGGHRWCRRIMPE